MTCVTCVTSLKENPNRATFCATFSSLYRKIENQTPYLYGLNHLYSSLDKVSINLVMVL